MYKPLTVFNQKRVLHFVFLIIFPNQFLKRQGGVVLFMKNLKLNVNNITFFLKIMVYYIPLCVCVCLMNIVAFIYASYTLCSAYIEYTSDFMCIYNKCVYVCVCARACDNV